MRIRLPNRYQLATRRAQHLVYLAHVWACVPFLLLWSMDLRIRSALGVEAVHQLQPAIGLTLVYLALRTWHAFRAPKEMPWEFIYSPVDVLVVSGLLYLSHRGPMSNIALLFFFPMVSAASSLSVRWAAAVGVMVVAGTALSTFSTAELIPPENYQTAGEILKAEPLNAAFRLYFLIVLASLMAFQASIAAGLKQRLAVAADRNRIALDMHDGVQGHLIALAQQLELLGHVAERNPDRAGELAREGRDTARRAADELRFLVHRLRAQSLEDGFVPALRQYAHNICARHALALEFVIEGAERGLDPDIENALFRVAQEALNNVVKHAQASRVDIEIEFTPQRVSLTLRDNGVGLPNPVEPGVGLSGMNHRVTELGGDIQVRSVLPRGTEVRAEVASASVAS